MNVNEAFHILEKLKEAGHGDLQIIAIDTRTGFSDYAEIGDVELIPKPCGPLFNGALLKEEPGTEFIPIYLG